MIPDESPFAILAHSIAAIPFSTFFRWRLDTLNEQGASPCHYK